MPDWTAADPPSFAGRTAIVTGANGGLGEVTARELARVGAQVILAVRNTEKGEAAAQQMTGDVEVRQLDLQDLSSVRHFADGVDTVDVLVNNAGIMATKYAFTTDGFEGQIGTNRTYRRSVWSSPATSPTTACTSTCWKPAAAACGHGWQRSIWSPT